MINKKQLTIIVSTIIFIILVLIIVRIFFTEKIKTVDNNIGGSIERISDGIIYPVLRGDDIEIRKIDNDATSPETLMTIKDASQIIQFKFSTDNKYALIFKYKKSIPFDNKDFDPRGFLSVYKNGVLRDEMAPAPSDCYFTDDTQLLCYQENSEFASEDGFFYSYNLESRKKQKLLKYSTEGIAFVNKLNNKLVFQSTASDSGWEIDYLYSYDLENNRVENYLTIDGLVGIEFLDEENTLVTIKEKEKYNVYQYNVLSRQKTFLSANNYSIRIGLLEGNYYGFELGDPKTNIYDFQETNTNDVFSQLTPRKKSLSNNKALKNCLNPIILSRKEAYFNCGNTLYKLINYRY